MSEFQPFVPANESRPELTFRALLLGSLFGIIFGGVTVYVGLKAGLTVAASIPISVLSISILRAFGKASILENNIVQTTGNAGQSIASGVIFTLPALVFLGFDLEYSRIFLLALIGGWLGVLFMIPLRRQLIVQEHGALPYPEGTACAEVLIAGEKGGSLASRVFFGLGLGALYTLFQNDNIFKAWPGTPEFQPDFGPQNILKGASIKADATPEYLGVGYIIGPRVAGVIFAGGIFSWLVLMPLIYFFGKSLPNPIYPGTIPISQMGPSQLWSTYIRPMGAGAVAAAGLITLLKTVPTIMSALTAGFRNMKPGAAKKTPIRTEDDLSMSVVVFGSLALVALMFVFLEFKPVPGAFVGWAANLAASLLVVVFGFLFVTVSSRIVGLIGSSASPVSGMTIATLMATSAIFLVQGWTAPAFGALAITIGGVVCIAASNSGDTSQDLKTGFLIGATPWKQQVALMIGVVISTFAIGATLNLMNTGLQQFKAAPEAWDLSASHPGVTVQQDVKHLPEQFPVINADKSTATHHKSEYVVLNSVGSAELADGKYLYSPATGKIEVQWIQGIGSEKAAAPQARLMATVISGILSRKLPWGLVMMGVFLVIAVELLGIRSLSFAVGSYLSIGTTLAIFCGGVVRWLVDRAAAREGDDTSEVESEISPGSLYASGLIAAGGIVGLMGVALSAMGKDGLVRFPETNFLNHTWVSVLAFALLGYSLYYFARKPLKK
ncbi:OPT family oligopeptide transporter [Terracidiphilus gabretensis]|uniref:OPT family oligopeptide transporter n=1 Tax=Terracidiphilus gabretensis TaxID=1577687 RepID=UPI00071BCA08|nr:oligopeptide transporter, OPT family [Terracidiphilus gabretensis]